MNRQSPNDHRDWSRLFFFGFVALFALACALLCVVALYEGNSGGALCFGALFLICLLIAFSER